MNKADWLCDSDGTIPISTKNPRSTMIKPQVLAILQAEGDGLVGTLLRTETLFEVVVTEPNAASVS